MAQVQFSIEVPVDSALTLDGDLVVEGPFTIDFSRGIISGVFHAVNSDLVDIRSTPVSQVGASTGSAVAQEAAAAPAVPATPVQDAAAPEVG